MGQRRLLACTVEVKFPSNKLFFALLCFFKLFEHSFHIGDKKASFWIFRVSFIFFRFSRLCVNFFSYLHSLYEKTKIFSTSRIVQFFLTLKIFFLVKAKFFRNTFSALLTFLNCLRFSFQVDVREGKAFNIFFGIVYTFYSILRLFVIFILRLTPWGKRLEFHLTINSSSLLILHRVC